MPKYCVELGCNKYPSYNYPGVKGRVACTDHYLYGMVNVKNLKCSCGKYTQNDLNGLCTLCARKNGKVSPVRGCKNNCGKEKKNGDYCISCYNEKNGIVKKVGEITLKNFLKDKFPELRLKTEFKILTYRVDFILELEKLIIVIEHDQKQHRGMIYPPERETERENEIFEELSKHKRCVIIRFNPDNYRLGGDLMKTPLEQRFEKIEDLISECIFDDTKSGIFRLFYNK